MQIPWVSGVNGADTGAPSRTSLWQRYQQRHHQQLSCLECQPWAMGLPGLPQSVFLVHVRDDPPDARRMSWCQLHSCEHFVNSRLGCVCWAPWPVQGHHTLLLPTCYGFGPRTSWASKHILSAPFLCPHLLHHSSPFSLRPSLGFALGRVCPSLTHCGQALAITAVDLWSSFLVTAKGLGASKCGQ